MNQTISTSHPRGEKSSPESLKPETDNVQIFQLVQKLLERPVVFHRIFAKIGGGVTAGLMLSQAWYWSNNKTAKARGGWFYKSQDDWEDETGLTRREQETARRRLKERGLLEEKLAGVPATLHFRVNIERLFRTLLEAEREPAPEAPPVQSSLAETYNPVCTFPPNWIGGNVQTISETTSETTAENTHTNSRLRAVGAPAGVVGGSKFSLPDCRRYADYLHSTGQGVNNPGGFARTIHASGSEDELIGLCLAKLEPERVERGELPAPLDTKNCPDCGGSTMRPAAGPGDYSKGMMKCRHERLVHQGVA